MKNAIYVVCFFFLALTLSCSKQETKEAQETTTWPDSTPWWKANNLRTMQTNLPAYEADLNVDSLINDLKGFSVNSLIINAGGIMAFYPTKLEDQYTNPFMKENMLGDVISKCHENGIRVIVRFDFSRAHESIFDRHPDWFYLSPKGERIRNDDMYVISINAPYEQKVLFDIVGEVIDLYAIDGIFINMPGYQTRNAYEGVYHGIDQNPYDKERFMAYSGMMLPLAENDGDPVFQKYQEFKKFTVDDLMKRLHTMVKAKNEQIAICTYMGNYVDIIRHESHPSGLPYWPYSASDNVNNVENSYPDHIISNASIQQISFQSRYNAVEPEESAIRLYQNIANGSGLDMSIMGDFQGNEDERSYEVFREVYAHHKANEKYYGHYMSPAEIAVVSPGYWPGGERAQEYRGIQLMLKEAHLQFDLIEDAQLSKLGSKMKGYKVIILPEIVSLDSGSLAVIEAAVAGGTHLIATNKSLSGHPDALLELFGAKAVQPDQDGTGYYLAPEKKSIFKGFDLQSLIMFKFNLGFYNFDQADETYLPIYTPGRPGPPEKIGGHEPTGYKAVAVKNHSASKAVLMPINLGRLYYIHGYEEHKQILLDIINYLEPDISDLLTTNAHPRVEAVLQKYVENTPENFGRQEEDGIILHLVNITGFSGNTFFEPLKVNDLEFRVRCEVKPSKVFTMVGSDPVDYRWSDGYLQLKIEELGQYEAVVIEK
ncbi:alpha-amylase family protein [uncultured Imperialibacter sp.]|uniref:alpha-amylase family protein n=1 Tax=uncultured Imperialibacter sp. TaxID=1672639 RepID=UPI0030DAEC75|tara:strand:+ start:74215 stop:76347 length:2133 start_codon:yes stop_codon:yes gene_type:complete